jgi:hypothetical protein
MRAQCLVVDLSRLDRRPERPGLHRTRARSIVRRCSRTPNRRRQAHGGRLVLTNAAPILRRVSHLLGLDTALGLTPAHRPTTLNAHAEPRGP